MQAEKNLTEPPLPVADSPARAAYFSRLDPVTMSLREEKLFPEVCQGQQVGQVILFWTCWSH